MLTENHDVFLSIKDVREIVHISASNIYRLMKNNQFPVCIKIGAKSYWSYKTLMAWLADKVKQANPGYSD
jgi:predicted DNA-binding transcriptional regulator AlpA